MGSDESKGTGGDNHPGETLNRDAFWRCGDGCRRVKNLFEHTRTVGATQHQNSRVFVIWLQSGAVFCPFLQLIDLSLESDANPKPTAAVKTVS